MGKMFYHGHSTMHMMIPITRSILIGGSCGHKVVRLYLFQVGRELRLLRNKGMGGDQQDFSQMVQAQAILLHIAIQVTQIM